MSISASRSALIWSATRSRSSRWTNTVRFKEHSQPTSGALASSALATKAVPLAPASARMSTQLTWLATKNTSRRSGVPWRSTRAPTIHAAIARYHLGQGDP